MCCLIITGRVNSDRTGTLYHQLFATLEEGTKAVYFVLPEQATFRHELEIEEIRADRSLWNLQITSLGRLADRHVSGAVMDGLGRNLLIYGLLAENRDRLLALKPNDISGGFVEDIGSVLKEVFMNGLNSDELLEKAELLEQRESAGDLPDKLRDIALLTEAMEEAGYRDESNLLFDFSALIAEKGLFKDAVFCFDEFFDFTAAEYAVLKALIANGCSLCFSFLFEDNHETVFAKTRKAVAKLTQFAQEAGVTPTIMALPTIVPDNALGFLEQHFFGYDGAMYSAPSEELWIVAAADKRGEIRHMAQEICDLTEKGYRRSDIGICFRSLTGYDKYIEEIFPSYGIPCFIDKEVPLLHHPVFRFGAGLLRVAAEKWSFPAVFSLLKTGLFPLEEHDCDVLENYCLAHALKGRRFYQTESWTYCNERENEDPAAAEEIRQSMLKVLLPAVKSVKNKDTAQGYATAIWLFIEACRCDLTVEQWCAEEGARGALKKSAELSAGVASFGEMLDQLVAAFPTRQFTVTAFLELLKLGAAAVAVKTIPSRLDTVEINILGQSRPARKKVVFIGGCNEGVFPAAAGDAGFLNSADRTIIKELTDGWVQDKTFFYENEELLAYQGLTLATEKLILSYTRRNEEGTSYPSVLVERVKRMFPLSEEIVADALFGGAQMFYSLDEVLAALPASLRDTADQSWEEVKATLLAKEETAERTAKLLTSLDYTGESGRLLPPILSSYPGRELSLSVSAIDKYRRCPFAYFSCYGLKLKERKILQFGAPDLGNIFHDTLCALMETMQRQGIPWAEMAFQGKELAKEIVGEKLRQFAEENLFPEEQLGYIGVLLAENLLFVIDMMALQTKNGDVFYPQLWEVPFGRGEGLPGETIPLDDKGHVVTLNGVIDRVDVAEIEGERYFRVVDYKSFGKELHLDDIYYGLKLQLPVYMMVVEDNKEARPAGFFYQSLKNTMISTAKPQEESEIEAKLGTEMELKGYIVSDGISEKGYALNKKGRVLTAADHEKILSFTRRKIKKIGNEIIAGCTEIKPFLRKQELSCEYCPYDAVCGFEGEMKEREERLHDIKDGEALILLTKEDEES